MKKISAFVHKINFYVAFYKIYPELKIANFDSIYLIAKALTTQIS